MEWNREKNRIWTSVMGCVATANVFTMFPQLLKIAATHETSGLSLPTFCVALFMQLMFGIHGLVINDRTLMWSMWASAVFTASIVGMTIYFRF